MSKPATTLKFGAYEINVELGELRKLGLRIKLQDKPFQILVALLDAPGQLVSREDLHRRLWPGNTFVDFDHNLNNAVDKLRKALNDSAEKPRFIETWPRRGYRFIASVEPGAPPASGKAPSPLTPDIEPLRMPQPLEMHSASGDPSSPAGSIHFETPTSLVTTGTRFSPAAAPGQPPHKPNYSLRILSGFLLALGAVVGALLVLRTARGFQNPDVAAFQRLLVLPVQNLTANPEHDYLAEGMTDELIAGIRKLDPEALGVIGPATATRLKGSPKSPVELGRQLNVQYVLAGSLRQSDGRTRLSAQLIRVADEIQVWAADYERENGNLFGISNEVSLSVGKQLRLHRLTGAGAGYIEEGAKNSQAYEDYLRGRFFWNKRLKEDVSIAQQYFAKAAAEDPNYAKAYAGLADSYIVLAGSHMPAQVAFEKARESAEKAIFLDKTLGEPHNSLAYIMYAQNWDWAGAEKEYQSSIEVDPQYALARHWYFIYLTAMKRYPEAIKQAEKALELDPLSQSINYNAAMTYIIAGQHDRGSRQLEKAIELDPNNPVAYGYLGILYEREQKYHDAVEQFRKAEGLESEKFTYTFDMAGAYSREGKTAEARRLAATLTAYAQRHYVNPYWLVAMYAGFEDSANAISWLDLAIRQHSCTALEVNTDSRLDFMRTDPRFQQAIGPMHLPH